MDRFISKGFESSIVKSFSGWDGDLECIQFYDPEFAVKVGEFEPNIIQKGYCVCFELSKAEFSVYDNDGSVLFSSKFFAKLE